MLPEVLQSGAIGSRFISAGSEGPNRRREESMFWEVFPFIMFAVAALLMRFP